VIVIEGQGALSHPAYLSSGFIPRGACPQAVVLQHAPARQMLSDFPFLPMPSAASEISLIEAFAPTRVIGLTLNHEGLDDAQLDAASLSHQAELGLPVTDAVSGSPQALVAMVEASPQIPQISARSRLRLGNSWPASSHCAPAGRRAGVGWPAPPPDRGRGAGSHRAQKAIALRLAESARTIQPPDVRAQACRWKSRTEFLALVLPPAGDLSRRVPCRCQTAQAEVNVGRVIGKKMLNSRTRIDVVDRNCHEPALHETAESRLDRWLPDPRQLDRLGATGKGGDRSADRILGGLP
jgi:hypothetical protein